MKHRLSKLIVGLSFWHFFVGCEKKLQQKQNPRSFNATSQNAPLLSILRNAKPQISPIQTKEKKCQCTFSHRCLFVTVCHFAPRVWKCRFPTFARQARKNIRILHRDEFQDSPGLAWLCPQIAHWNEKKTAPNGNRRFPWLTLPQPPRHCETGKQEETESPRHLALNAEKMRKFGAVLVELWLDPLWLIGCKLTISWGNARNLAGWRSSLPPTPIGRGGSSPAIVFVCFRLANTTFSIFHTSTGLPTMAAKHVKAIKKGTLHRLATTRAMASLPGAWETGVV